MFSGNALITEQRLLMSQQRGPQDRKGRRRAANLAGCHQAIVPLMHAAIPVLARGLLPSPWPMGPFWLLPAGPDQAELPLRPGVVIAQVSRSFWNVSSPENNPGCALSRRLPGWQ